MKRLADAASRCLLALARIPPFAESAEPAGTAAAAAGPQPAADANGRDRGASTTLEQRLQKVEDELDAARRTTTAYLEEKLDGAAAADRQDQRLPRRRCFATTGNGAGTRTDCRTPTFPEYADVPGSWVFMGDPLSTTINSRGDVADTGESRAIVFDPINSRGKSTFLVNALNLALFSGIGETAQLNASVDFVPRARDISNPNGPVPRRLPRRQARVRRVAAAKSQTERST